MRPRRESGASARPFNFTVRFRMRQAPAFLLTALVALGSNSAPGSDTAVLIRMASEDTCVVAEVHVSCREVGAKMRELGIPAGTHVRCDVDHHSYEAVRTMVESLQRAGYKLGKVAVKASTSVSP